VAVRRPTATATASSSSRSSGGSFAPTPTPVVTAGSAYRVDGVIELSERFDVVTDGTPLAAAGSYQPS
jgi:hypothetical protein